MHGSAIPSVWIAIDPKDIEAAQAEYQARVGAEYEEMRAESRARRRA
jgi:hypothetical protein